MLSLGGAHAQNSLRKLEPQLLKSRGQGEGRGPTGASGKLQELGAGLAGWEVGKGHLARVEREGSRTKEARSLQREGFL